MKNSRIINIFFIIAICFSCFSLRSYADNSVVKIIPAGSTKIGAVLGSAYLSDREVFAGDRCVAGDSELGMAVGLAQAGFTFGSVISEEQLASELGLAAGGRAQYGAAEYSGSVAFMRQSMSNTLSVSAVWESSYSFPADHLIGPNLSSIGQSVINNDERWAQTCGDRYVAEISRGAKLFFSIRIDFKNRTEKDAFEAKFSVSGPLYGANATLANASQSFSRHTKVTVTALQVGGDISKVTGLFDSGDQGPQTLVQCELGSYETCAQVVLKALKYAADTREGFPSQIAPGVLPGPAVLSYGVVPYSSIGIYPKSYPHLDEATKMARQELSQLFLNQQKYSVLGDRILQQRGLGTRQIKIQKQMNILSNNISQILEASKVCYDTPTECWNAVKNKIKLKNIDKEVFEPESFASLCREARESDDYSPSRITLNSLQSAMSLDDNISCSDLEKRALSLTTLVLVSVIDKPISDLRILQTMTKLQQLSVENGWVADLSPLAELENLKSLDLSANRIVDLQPLAQLQDLLRLDLSRNRVRSVGPLSGMFNLQWLMLEQNLISNLSEFQYFPNLIAVDLRTNPLTPAEIESFRNRIPKNTVVTE